MYTKGLSLNQSIELELKSGVSFKTQVITINSNSFIVLSELPVESLTDHYEELTVYFQNQNERYKFSTTVLAADSRTVPYRIQLSLPDSQGIKRIQNREYFRVPSIVSVEINSGIPGLPNHRYKTRDISGGGISFISDNPLYMENQLKGVMFLKQNGNIIPISFRARIVHVSQIREKEYLVALQFTHILDSHRNSIIQYCIREQLKRRKK